MKIGVDLRVLQVGHQYRGIGEVAKRTLNRVFELAMAEGDQPSFVFYRYDDDEDPKQFLTIPSGLSYEEVSLGLQPLKQHARSKLQKALYKMRLWYGNPIPQAKNCDMLLQFDYALGVPRHPKTVLVKHDIIPYIFWSKYFTSSWVRFKHRAARTTIRNLIQNYEYKRLLKRSLHDAWRIMCVSEHTKKDLERYFRVSPKKMQVIHLGVSELALTNRVAKKPAKYPTKPFLLFIGAIDARRRAVDDLVAAYNNLKAEGRDVQLVLAGENFQSPEKIPNKIVRNAVLGSSYADDILTLGYIDDATKQKLFREAIAFVFPTNYEGFGIPVLEAMLMGCPVIAYKNSSIPEVGGECVLYASGWEDIWRQTETIMAMGTADRKALLERARHHAQAFTWDKTGDRLYELLVIR